MPQTMIMSDIENAAAGPPSLPQLNSVNPDASHRLCVHRLGLCVHSPPRCVHSCNPDSLETPHLPAQTQREEHRISRSCVHNAGATVHNLAQRPVRGAQATTEPASNSTHRSRQEGRCHRIGKRPSPSTKRSKGLCCFCKSPGSARHLGRICAEPGDLCAPFSPAVPSPRIHERPSRPLRRRP